MFILRKEEIKKKINNATNNTGSNKNWKVTKYLNI